MKKLTDIVKRGLFAMTLAVVAMALQRASDMFGRAFFKVLLSR